MSNQPDPAGDFIDACIDDLDQARQLFAADPAVLYRTQLGSPLLHWFVIEDFQIAVQRMLEVFHVDVEHRDQFGRTALHAACFSGRLGSVRLLLKHGADPEAVRQGFADNCLHIAVSGAHLDVACILLEFGAKPDYQIDSCTTIGHAMASWIPENRQLLLEQLEAYGITPAVLMKRHGLDEIYDSPEEAYGW
jgi:hypothetical protein